MEPRFFFYGKQINDEPTMRHNAEYLTVTAGGTYRYFLTVKTGVTNFLPK
jgi:hypothetical protein